MRILFLESGKIWPYTLPQGLVDLGHEVSISGPLSKENIAQLIVKFNPDFAVSIGWGYENMEKKPKWIRQAIQETGIPLVYWAIEDPAFTKKFSLPLITAMQPDFVFSLCPKTVDLYRQKGINAAHMEFGFNPHIHKYDPALADFSNSIVVVANAYPHVLGTQPNHYRHTAINTLITPLLKNNVRINFWGHDWDKLSAYGLTISKSQLHGFMPYVHTNQIYSSAGIVLGLQNYQHIVSQRTFEVLGSAGFLLTMDTPAVRKISPDIVTTASPEQTLQLVEYYLHHPEKRKQISKAGQQAVCHHTYRQRAAYMLQVLHEQKIICSH